MAVTLSATSQAVGPGRPSSVLAIGGVGPYVYSVIPGGAGGSIDPSTGVYLAPLTLSTDPRLSFDTILATDSTPVTPLTGTIQMNVLDTLNLVCDIIRKEMTLTDDQVYIYNQKFIIPKDSRIYVPVGILSLKPFGNTNQMAPVTGGFTSVQSVNVMATLDINILSRSTEALLRKEEVLMAVASNYSLQQQQLNSFSLAVITKSLVNLSNVDGAAIPYMFTFSLNVQYFISKISAVPYFNTFPTPAIYTNA